MSNSFQKLAGFDTPLDPSRDPSIDTFIPSNISGVENRSMTRVMLNDSTNTAMPTMNELTFPVKLHMILSSQRFEHILSWLPSGRAWMILDPLAFEEQVLPIFFKTSLASFCRQMNGWGFRRSSKSYHHELFLRDMPRLTEKMKYRATAKDEIAQRRFQLGARAPNMPSASPRLNPMTPRDLSVLQHSTRLAAIGTFVSSLSDDEVTFLLTGRRRTQASVISASAQQDKPLDLLRSDGDLERYLTGVSDRLREFTSKLRESAIAAEEPVAKAIGQSDIASATDDDDDEEEEELSFAMQLSRKLETNVLAEIVALSQERSRWAKMKQDMKIEPLHESNSLQDLPLCQVEATPVTTNDAVIRESPPLVSLRSARLAAPKQAESPLHSTMSPRCRSSSNDGAKAEATIPPAAVQNDALFRASKGNASIPISEATEQTAALSRTRQANQANDLPNSLRDSLSIVKAAYDAMRCAGVLDRAQLRQGEQQSNQGLEQKDVSVGADLGSSADNNETPILNGGESNRDEPHVVAV